MKCTTKVLAINLLNIITIIINVNVAIIIIITIIID